MIAQILTALRGAILALELAASQMGLLINEEKIKCVLFKNTVPDPYLEIDSYLLSSMQYWEKYKYHTVQWKWHSGCTSHNKYKNKIILWTTEELTSGVSSEAASSDPLIHAKPERIACIGVSGQVSSSGCSTDTTTKKFILLHFSLAFT